MGKKCRCPPQPAEVPTWFMTYSDVITLLMTFFILLLTFATNEPESFERMQTAVFGGGGATGVAGDTENAVDQDAMVVRFRPNTGRMTNRGSEMPPMDSDPVKKSIRKGLKSLETLEDLASAERVSMVLPLRLIRDHQGLPTDLCVQQLRMLAVQLRSMQLEVEFQAVEPADSDFCVSLARFMLETQRIPPGRVSVSRAGPGAVPSGSIRILLTRMQTH
jgi:chemotaxis protein MotB